MTGARLQGEESWSIPLQELFPGKRIALWCHLSPVVQAHKVHCCFYFPQPCLNHRNAGNRTGCSLGTVFTKPPVQSPIQIFGSQASGPPAGAMESAQTPAPPPHACTCKACSCQHWTHPSHWSTISPLGYPIGPSLQSCWQWYK